MIHFTSITNIYSILTFLYLCSGQPFGSCWPPSRTKILFDSPVTC